MKPKSLIIFAVFLFTTSLWEQEGQTVKISTDFGEIIVLLYHDTPILYRDNFSALTRAGNYNDGTLFRSVISGFMIQGGDFNSIEPSPTQALGVDNCPKNQNEIRRNQFYKKGTLAAARLPVNYNSEQLSSGYQFL